MRSGKGKGKGGRYYFSKNTAIEILHETSYFREQYSRGFVQYFTQYFYAGHRVVILVSQWKILHEILHEILQKILEIRGLTRCEKTGCGRQVEREKFSLFSFPASFLSSAHSHISLSAEGVNPQNNHDPVAAGEEDDNNDTDEEEDMPLPPPPAAAAHARAARQQAARRC